MASHRGVSFVLAAMAAVWLLACVVPTGGDDLASTERHDAIIGGSEEWGFPLVGTLAGDMGDGSIYPFCTATPVTPTVIITAAHCTDAFSTVGNVVVFARLNPDGTGSSHDVVASSRRNHPGWDPYGMGYVNDVAVVQLQDPIDVDLFPAMHRTQMGGGDIGSTVKVVGFGVNQAPDQGAGTKRSIDMTVVEVYGQYFVMRHAENWRGVCYGDSGGPSFVQGAIRDTQVGVHARTQVESCGPAEDTSVGYFYDSFVRSNVLALDADAETCGDEVCTGLEDESGCPQDCSPYECGDGAVEGPEVCDDSNTAGGDGCSADCLSDESCGNGVADTVAGEVCDDGNTAGGDGCSGDCHSNEICGNGVTDTAAGEVCDDANAAGGDGCSSDCRSDESCGNGVTDAEVGEACDDGNTSSGDGCSGDCLVAEGCGNGEVEPAFGEVCDDGNERGGDGCSANCRSDESCGNGVTDTEVGETCDDGNEIDGDECAFDCGVPDLTGMPGLVGGCGCQIQRASPSRALATLFAL